MVRGGLLCGVSRRVSKRAKGKGYHTSGRRRKRQGNKPEDAIILAGRGETKEKGVETLPWTCQGRPPGQGSCGTRRVALVLVLMGGGGSCPVRGSVGDKMGGVGWLRGAGASSKGTV